LVQRPTEKWAAALAPGCAGRALELARTLGDSRFSAAYFKAIAAIDGLDVEDLAARKSQNALDGRRDVLVHSIREFDHDNRSLARSSNEPASNGAGTLPELAQHDVHTMKLAFQRPASTAAVMLRSSGCAIKGCGFFDWATRFRDFWGAAHLPEPSRYVCRSQQVSGMQSDSVCLSARPSRSLGEFFLGVPAL